MKKAIIYFGFLIVLFSSCKKEDVYQNISSDDISLANVLVNVKLKVGVNPYQPPLCFYEKEYLNGFDIDVLSEVANLMDIDIEFVPIRYDMRFELINEGVIDCLASGFSYTDERSKKYELTSPYLRNAQIILTLAAKNYKRIEDLRGKKIGGQKNSVGISIIKNNAKFDNFFLSIHDNYDNTVQVINDVKSLGIDACIGDIITISKILKDSPKVYSVLPEPIALDFYVYAFKKGSVSLKNAVESALFELEKNGTLEKISRKWFNADYIIFGK